MDSFAKVDFLIIAQIYSQLNFLSFTKRMKKRLYSSDVILKMFERIYNLKVNNYTSKTFH